MKQVGTEDKIIFLHLPKAAGTTFNGIISKQYKESEVFSVSRVVKESLGENWGAYPTREREALAKVKLSELKDADLEELKIVAGHMEFGWHTLLKAPSSYITFLRDPVDRVISQYHYILRLNNHLIKDQIASENLTMLQFVERGLSSVSDNGMTRKLAGITDEVPFQQYSDNILETAVANIETNFGAIGLAEYFDESVLLIKLKLGWSMPFYRTKNATRNRSVVNDYDKKTLDAIRDHNALDIKLYQHAHEIFKSELAHLGSNFGARLWTFRKMNQLYQRAQPLLRRFN